MGTELIVIAAAVFVGCLLVLRYGLKRRRSGPRRLGPGSRVRHNGIDHKVLGTVTYRRGPYVYWEHLLDGRPEPIWFGVDEVDGQLDLTWWVKRSDLALRPGAEHVIDRVTFRQIERGRARFTSEGTTGLPTEGVVDYIDYANADESAMLSFERWTADMPWEISTGKCLLPSEVTIHRARSR